ncbi:MAG TPA: N-6 DNA methylase [Thermoanaerobaculia bacterium]|nr:N-6 DNA methylase [Thermoanaerobaculia bacterium]
MITAGDLRACRGAAGVADLFRRLGYPVEPVAIDRAEWGRAGIDLPCAGEGRMLLLARLDHFDLFLAEGAVEPASITRFLLEYSKYNLLTKSAIINLDEQSRILTIHVLNGRSPRHATIACADPTPHGLDRLNLLALDGRDDPSRLFDRALDREAVARQFFVRFRAAAGDLAAALAGSCPGESAAALADEALLILSRLLFLCFVQEKGWLNGERRFLIDRAERAVSEGTDFFTTVLLPLFFGCLNTPASQRDAVAGRLGRIPYLNGGLFEPAALERRNPSLHVPTALMRQVLEDVFEKFDFTVDESAAAGTRVDPEMLGKVFESLMAGDERAVSGSFYTPREIVDVLTGRAIAEWAGGGDAGLRDELQSVIGGGIASPRLAEAAPEVMGRLETITILDPACGSGAFLLSALNTIERLIAALSATRPATLRQRIVERSLYGVDLKAEAVRLCELRLWLAIVAGADVTADQVRPLPNLDRNILQGNSLLSPLDFLGAARGDIYRDWAVGIRAQHDLIERYRSAAREERPALFRLLRANDRRLASDLLSRAIDADERELQAATAPRLDLFGRPLREDLDAVRHLQRRIREARQTLERVEGGEVDFFAFDVHFAHVMAQGGFDVVAGNPPWVRNARIDPGARRMYRDRYPLFGGATAGSPFHQPDLSVAFVERSLALAGDGGVVAMLLPAKIANAAYAAPLREFLLGRASLTALIDWADERRRYFNADTFPLGLVARKGEDASRPVEIRSGGSAFFVAPSALPVAGRRSEWSLVPPDAGRILRRLRERFAPLETAIGRRPVMGVKTGDNRSFFLDGTSVDCGWLHTGDGLPIPTGFVCRCVRGRDVRRWTTRASHWMLWPPAAGWTQYPPWLQQIAVRRGVDPEVLELSYVRPEHVGIKVAWKDVSRGMAAVVLPESVEVSGHSFPLVPNQTLYSVDAVSLDEAYAMAGLLNSVVADALLLEIAERAKDDHYRYFGRTVARIPFPLPDPASEPWQRLVRSSRVAHREGRAPAGHEECAGELFELTAAELEVLRAHVARRLPAR